MYPDHYSNSKSRIKRKMQKFEKKAYSHDIQQREATEELHEEKQIESTLLYMMKALVD